jgi:NET1-associated nuclear protein 1 (U3 small nucleolar RNA-associated protein 17)
VVSFFPWWPISVNDCFLVAWQSNLPLSIDKIISHRHESSFAVFHSMSAGEARVKVSIFQASSSTPLAIHSLPFTLRNVELNSFQASTGFSFVAITHAWRVVLIGDSIPRLTDEGLSPKAISLNGQRQNRTLFQDIFGVSAFEEDMHVNQTSTSAALSRKGVDHPLSDISAFATPSFDTFFDPFLTGFLTARELT